MRNRQKSVTPVRSPFSASFTDVLRINTILLFYAPYLSLGQTNTPHHSWSCVVWLRILFPKNINGLASMNCFCFQIRRNIISHTTVKRLSYPFSAVVSIKKPFTVHSACSEAITLCCVLFSEIPKEPGHPYVYSNGSIVFSN